MSVLALVLQVALSCGTLLGHANFYVGGEGGLEAAAGGLQAGEVVHAIVSDDDDSSALSRLLHTSLGEFFVSRIFPLADRFATATSGSEISLLFDEFIYGGTIDALGMVILDFVIQNINTELFHDVVELDLAETSEFLTEELPQFLGSRYVSRIAHAKSVIDGILANPIVQRMLQDTSASDETWLDDTTLSRVRGELEHRSVIDRLRDDEMSVDRRNAALQVFRFALSQWALARMVSREQRPTEDALDFIVNAWIAGLDTFAIIMPELQESLDAISTTDEALQGSEEAFLSDVYRLVEENLSRKAIAQVFDFLDDKVLAADFEACDRILRAVDLDRLDASTALGFLSITTQVRDRLSHRNGLLQRIERHLLQQRSPEYVETLLRGLR